MRSILYAVIVFILLLNSCKDNQSVLVTGPEATEAKLTILSPVKDDVLPAGSVQTIKWSSNSTLNLLIEFSSDGGVMWDTLAINVPNTGSYNWLVPDIKSVSCLLRLSLMGGTTQALSSSFFSIGSSTQKTLTLNNPNGGETLFVDSSFTIRWTSANIQNVKLQYSTNNGAAWTVITTAYPADSTYFQWHPIPQVSSNQCLIKVSDATADSISDVSNTVFTITTPKIVRVTSPNGKEIISAGSSHIISWYSIDVSNVKIEYTTNNGVNWTTIVQSTPSNGYFKWYPVPATISSLCKIRVSNTDEGPPYDESDDVFTISPERSITVLSPNGGEVWMSGTSQTIKWVSAGDSTGAPVTGKNNLKYNSIKKKLSDAQFTQGLQQNLGSIGNKTASGFTSVKIEYTVDNGVTWNSIADSVPNNGSYFWKSVPVQNSSLCRIRISNTVDGLPFDISDNTFIITDQQQQSIIVTAPNGGEQWQIGTQQNITWNSQGVAAVKIEYSTDNGYQWNVIDASTPSDGFYTWQVPNQASTNCKIKISDVADNYPADESNATFTIAPEPSVTVLSPDGGETWVTGTSQTITWSSENIENVKIEYTTNNGAKWNLITASTESDGNYTIDSVPNVNSSLCKIRVSDANDGVPSDVSDNVFTITNQITQSLTVTSPNGGEKWESGTSQNISWSATGVTLVNIDYTANNGLTWNSIVTDLPSTGSFQWDNIPNINSTQCKIRISDAVDGNPIDESNSTFTIKPVQSIVVAAPNGGESYEAGSKVHIKWTSSSVENVKIEYTINNGLRPEDWFTLVSSAPSNGEYITGFSVPSNQYRIRISDAVDGSPSDQSDGTFTITPQPQRDITVTAPNGGENWLTNYQVAGQLNTYEIRWTSTNIKNVKIEYTLNGGEGWKTIVSSVPSNGLYNWVTPSTIDYRSDLCQIKISNIDDTTFAPFDVSDSYFSLHPQTRFLRMVFPNGGENITKLFGIPDTVITWHSAGITNVGIDYSLDNGMTWAPIAANIQSTGAYRWTIPPTTVTSSLARIRVYDASDVNFSDQSDSYFFLNYLIPPPTIVNISDGETVKADANKVINWTASEKTTAVRLEYSTNAGKTWQAIADNLRSKANTVNSFNWKSAPYGKNSNVMIRVIDIKNKKSSQIKSFNISN